MKWLKRDREKVEWEGSRCKECGCSQNSSSWSRANKSRHTDTFTICCILSLCMCIHWHTFSDWNKLHRLHREAYCTHCSVRAKSESAHAYSIHLFSIFRINCYGFHVAMKLRRKWIKRERERENQQKRKRARWKKIREMQQNFCQANEFLFVIRNVI